MAHLLTSNPQLASGGGPSLVDDAQEQRDRVIWKSTVSRAAIKRLERRAGSEKDTCIITRETTKYVITIAYVIKRERNARNRNALIGFILGMKPHSFNAESSRNLLYLRIDLGQPFDNCGWALLPSQEILNAVYEYFQDVLENCLNGTMNTEDVKITNWLEHDWHAERHIFRVVPLRSWSLKTAICEGSSEEPNWGLGNAGVTVELWINPLAAIWDAGEKLKALAKQEFTFALVPRHHGSLLRTCRDIMDVWTGLAKYVPKAHLERPVKVDGTNDKAKGKARSTRNSMRAANSPTPNSAVDGAESMANKNMDLTMEGSHASGRSVKRRRVLKNTSEAAQGNTSAGGSRASSGRAP